MVSYFKTEISFKYSEVDDFSNTSVYFASY